MKQRFLVGSRAFFAGIDGFKSPNRNILELVGNPAFLAGKEQNERVTRIYKYTRQPAPKMIADAVASGDAKKLGKFLVPDVARAIGMTIKDLQALQPLRKLHRPLRRLLHRFRSHQRSRQLSRSTRRLLPIRTRTEM